MGHVTMVSAGYKLSKVTDTYSAGWVEEITSPRCERLRTLADRARGMVDDTWDELANASKREEVDRLARRYSFRFARWQTLQSAMEAERDATTIRLIVQGPNRTPAQLWRSIQAHMSRTMQGMADEMWLSDI